MKSGFYFLTGCVLVCATFIICFYVDFHLGGRNDEIALMTYVHNNSKPQQCIFDDSFGHKCKYDIICKMTKDEYNSVYKPTATHARVFDYVIFCNANVWLNEDCGDNIETDKQCIYRVYVTDSDYGAYANLDVKNFYIDDKYIKLSKKDVNNKMIEMIEMIDMSASTTETPAHDDLEYSVIIKNSFAIDNGIINGKSGSIEFIDKHEPDNSEYDKMPCYYKYCK